MTSPSVRLAEPRRASSPVWKTLVSQRGCPLFGRNQPLSPQKSPKFPKSEFFVADRLTGPFFKPSIFINNIYLLLYNTRKR